MTDFDRHATQLGPSEDLVPFGPLCDVLQHFEAPNFVKISIFGSLRQAPRALASELAT